jgi:hypothetical protein
VAENVVTGESDGLVLGAEGVAADHAVLDRMQLRVDEVFHGGRVVLSGRSVGQNTMFMVHSMRWMNTLGIGVCGSVVIVVK